MSLFRNKQLLALSLGHFGVDMYPNILPVIFPLLMTSLDMNYTKVGFLMLAYSIVSSVLQPLLGYLADRHGGRFFAAGGVLATALAAGMLGVAWSYSVLLVLICVCALGSAFFHPQGSMNTAAVTGPRQRALGMSIYMLGGSAGFAIGPLLGAAVVASPWGLRSTLLLSIPGLLIGYWLTRLMVKVDQVKRASVHHSVDRPTVLRPRHAIFGLTVIIAIVMFRSWAFQGLANFLPLWYEERRLSAVLASELLFVILISSAAGGLIGGYLADRFGQRRLVAFALLAAAPLLFLFLHSPANLVFPVGAVTGFVFGSTYSVALVMAQEMLPSSLGLASGLILGLAFVTGGIGTATTGWLADHYSLGLALDALVPLPLLGSALCLLVPVARVAKTVSSSARPAGSGMNRPI